jgi:protein ImuB
LNCYGAIVEVAVAWNWNETMKRVLCIWLPNWPIQRLLIAQPELKGRPVVLYRTSANSKGANSKRANSSTKSKRATRSKVSGLRIVACSNIAAQGGVTVGLSVAEARGLFQTAPTLPKKKIASEQKSSTAASEAPYFAEHDERADREAFEQLASWCQRFSPHIGFEQPHYEQSQSIDTLLLEITGCTHLFGNEEQLLEQVTAAFQQKNLIIETAIAGTVGTAWAVAHFVRELQREVVSSSDSAPHASFRPPGERNQCEVSRVIRTGQEESHLQPLPVAALRLDLAMLQTLQELDLRTIGRLLALPRASLPAHLGTQVVQRIDQAFGEVAESIVPFQPTQQVAVGQTFPHPICHQKSLAGELSQLIDRLVKQLQSRQEGVQGLHVRFDGADQDAVQFSLGLVGPSKSADYLTQMVLARMERQPIPREVLGVHIQAYSTAPLCVQQTELFEESADLTKHKQFQQLVDCLSMRLGEQAVLSATLLQDAQPEYAFRWQPRVQGTLPATLAGRVAPLNHSRNPLCVRTFFSARPIWLKQRPQPIVVLTALNDGPPIRFRWKSHDHLVVRSWGPERIATGWWRMSPVRRDYYRVETSQGHQFWVFRKIANAATPSAWFLHGVF